MGTKEKAPLYLPVSAPASKKQHLSLNKNYMKQLPLPITFVILTCVVACLIYGKYVLRVTNDNVSAPNYAPFQMKVMNESPSMGGGRNLEATDDGSYSYSDKPAADPLREAAEMVIFIASSTVGVLILVCGLVYINRSFAHEPVDLWPNLG